MFVCKLRHAGAMAPVSPNLRSLAILNLVSRCGTLLAVESAAVRNQQLETVIL